MGQYIKAEAAETGDAATGDSMSAREAPQSAPVMIEASFRHGSITAVGIITAFSLGFLTAWGANPVPWEVNDAFALVPIVVGVIFEIVALAKLLDVRCLELPRYRGAIRYFLTGMTLVAIGVALALVIDVVSLTRDHQATTIPEGHVTAE